jgi:hypothetical protein
MQDLNEIKPVPGPILAEVVILNKYLKPNDDKTSDDLPKKKDSEWLSYLVTLTVRNTIVKFDAQVFDELNENDFGQINEKYENKSYKSIKFMNCLLVFLFYFDIISDLVTCFVHYYNSDYYYFGFTLMFFILPVVINVLFYLNHVYQRSKDENNQQDENQNNESLLDVFINVLLILTQIQVGLL